METAWRWRRSDHAHISSWVNDGSHSLAQSMAGRAHNAARHASSLGERDPRHADAVGVIRRELHGEGWGWVVHWIAAGDRGCRGWWGEERLALAQVRARYGHSWRTVLSFVGEWHPMIRHAR